MSYIGNSPGVASQRVTTTLTATAGQTQFTTQSGYVLGYVDVYLNGVKLVNGADFEAITGTYVSLFAGALAGDVVELISYVPRGLSDGYTKAEADAKFLDVGGDTASGTINLGANGLVVGTNQLVTVGGKVGVGTATPVNGLLNVSNATNQISIDQGAAATYGRLDIGHFTNGTFIGTYAGSNAVSDVLRLGTSGTERARIDSSGNIAIGKQSASSRLHIGGSSGVNGAAVTLDIGAQQHAWYLSDSFTSVFNIGSGSASSTWAWTYSGGEVARLTTTGFGIGTTVPQSTLDVYKGTANSKVAYIASLSSYVADHGPTLVFRNGSSGEELAGLKGAFTQSSQGNYGHLSLLTRTSDAAGITEKVRITHTGSLSFANTNTYGIIRRNTVNGSNGISIQANTADVVDDTNAGAKIQIGGGVIGDTYEGNIDLYAYGSIVDSNRNQIRFYNRSGTNTVSERMRINHLGNVGIGTSAPNGALEIYRSLDSTTAAQQMLIISTDYGSGIGTGFGGSIVFRGRTAGNLLQDNAQILAYNPDSGDNGYALGLFTRPNNAAGMLQRVTISRNGNVGIGTTSPSTTLTLRNTHSAPTGTTYTGALLIHDEPNNVAPHLGMGVAYDGGANYSWIQSNSSAGTYPLVLQAAGGSVGVGTNLPQAKLHTLGASYASISSTNNHVRFEGGGGNGIAIGTLDASTGYASWLQSGYVPGFGTAVYPLLLNPLGGSVSAGSAARAPTTATKLVVGGGTWHRPTYSSSLAAGGNYIFNLFTHCGNTTFAAGVIRVIGTENQVNQTFAEYEFAMARYVHDGTGAINYYVKLKQRNRLQINNGYGSVFLYLSNYASSWTTTDQAANNGTTTVSGSTSIFDIYARNEAGQACSVAISVEFMDI